MKQYLLFKLGLAIALMLALLPASGQATASAPTDPSAASVADVGAIPLADMLKPDGTLALVQGRYGKIDMSGWQLVGGLESAPRFEPANPVPPDGAPGDENWTTNTGASSGTIYALAIDSSGNVYAGGSFTSIGGCTIDCNRIAKWDVSTSTWSALGTGMNNTVNALAVDSSGDVYAGGAFTPSSGFCSDDPDCRRIAKWDSSSSTWEDLDGGMGGMSGTVFDLVINPSSGDLYAGGGFTSAGSCTTGCNLIAKWNSSTSTWEDLDGGISGTYVYGLVVDSDNLYAGGSFTGAGSCDTTAGCNNIAQWDGSNWNALGTGTGDAVYALGADSAGNIYAGGIFSSAGSCDSTAGCNNIAQWDGSNWNALGTGTAGTVYALGADSADNIYAGGMFSSAGSCTTNCAYIARWDGSTWNALGSGVTNGVRVFAFDSNGKLYVAGNFSTAGGSAAGRFAIWTAATGQCGLSAGITYTFYAGNMPVQVYVNTLGDIDCITVQRFNTDHPNADTPQETGYYWSFKAIDSSNTDASGFNINLTLPYSAADANDKLCYWSGSTWYCAASSYVPNTSITLNYVTHLSEWAPGNNAPTAVTLAGFHAAPAPGFIGLSWQTTLELDTLGFNLYRSSSLDGERLRVNDELIAPKALGSPGGASYAFGDATVQPGQTYYYWLEVVNLDGLQTFDPVSAQALHGLFLPLTIR